MTWARHYARLCDSREDWQIETWLDRLVNKESLSSYFQTFFDILMDIDGRSFDNWQKLLKWNKIENLFIYCLKIKYSCCLSFYREISLANIYPVSNAPSVNQVSSVISYHHVRKHFHGKFFSYLNESHFAKIYQFPVRVCNSIMKNLKVITFLLLLAVAVSFAKVFSFMLPFILPSFFPK